MPVEFAEYGIAIFAIASLIYVVTQFLKQRTDQGIVKVVENNTEALRQVTQVIQAMQIMQVRQEQKIDELLERIRRE